LKNNFSREQGEQGLRIKDEVRKKEKGRR